jgi:hypothetical protein
MKRKRIIWLLSLPIVLFFLSGCATLETSPAPKPYEVTPKGTVIYKEEFEFVLPPSGWKLFWPEGEGDGEFAFGFMKKDPGPFPSQSVFAYDEEPFGFSTRLEEREKEFLKRFLWNAILDFQTLERKKIQILGYGRGKEPCQERKG